MLASLLRIILLTATLKILERGLDKGPIIYWGLLFLGLHGGLHTALPGRFKVSAIKNVVVRWISRLVIAVVGVLAFVKLDIFSYMTFQVHFAWNGDGMSAPVTVVAYALVFGLYAVVGNLIGHGCILNTKRK